MVNILFFCSHSDVFHADVNQTKNGHEKEKEVDVFKKINVKECVGERVQGDFQAMRKRLPSQKEDNTANDNKQ